MAANLIQDLFQRKARRRIRVTAFFCALWLLVVFGRLIQLQVFSHGRALEQVTAQNQRMITIQADRGTIYDRNGRILARSLPARTIYYAPANPQESLAARFEPIKRLRDKLDLSDEDLARIQGQLADNDKYIILKRKADPDLAAQVYSPRLVISYHEDSRRFYPLGRQAAHVLGGVQADESGAAGIEAKFNSSLAGKPGRGFILRDAKLRKYGFEVLEEPTIGRDLALTLDETIQYIAQSELEKAVAETRSAGGTVIVSNPVSGEILAMASAPTYDPNDFSQAAKADVINSAVQSAIEPGSTFKIITAAAAIESRVVSFAESFDCGKGSISTPGCAIRDHKTFGRLDFPGIIIHSSNVGAIQIGRRLDAASFEATIRAFGFGRKTGLELPGEAKGKLRPMTEWTPRSQSSLSIGYEISATPVQILQAVNVVANRGRLVPLRIIESIQGGRPRPEPALSDPVLSAASCEKLIGIMERVVGEGTGKEAAAEGYETAGKTGTTQKFDPEAKAYSSQHHIASFVGFVPAANPRLSMIVILDDPQTSGHYGGQIAAPVFREIARKALLVVGIPPRRSAGPLLAGLRKDGSR
ncbi:MAG: penicillin-binding protein 2 [Acidobacteriota bacterium]|nr:penicillin-binding protein 2 [Acidobacteriota bacterium]